jgi:pimeloyl-ACP methyl ester carboxylesterase
MFLTLTLAALAAVGVSRPAPATPSPAVCSASKDSIEAVELKTSDDLTLSATFYAPTIKGNVKVPGAVLLHGPGQDKSQLDELAKYLQRKGIGVLAVDLRGHGQSVSEACDWKTLDEKGQSTSWNLAIRDVQAATEYLRGRHEIHSNNLSLVGVGGGASLAVRQALDDDTVRALVLIAPTFENYGFSIVGGLSELAGLPTLVVSSKDQSAEASRFVNASEKANSGQSSIELSVVKSAPEAVLTDSSMRSALSTWLLDHVAPKR